MWNVVGLFADKNIKHIFFNFYMGKLVWISYLDLLTAAAATVYVLN